MNRITKIGEQKQLNSLVKSRQVLQKLTCRISQVEKTRENAKVIQSIESSSKRIQNSIDIKIEDSFYQLMNTKTLMPMSVLKHETYEKQNNMANMLSSIEGTKTLMYHYRQQNKNNLFENEQKAGLPRYMQTKKSQSKLPNIHTSNHDNRLAAFIKAKQKEKQIGAVNKQEPVIPENYHILINIINYKYQNQSRQFLKFHKQNYKRWDEIISILQALQKFSLFYKLENVKINTKSVINLLDRAKNERKKMSGHDLLSCLENANIISNLSNQPGIKYYGKQGKNRAIIKIQSYFKMKIQFKKYKQFQAKAKKTIIIQRYYRCRLEYKKTKDLIFTNQLSKLQSFNKLQQKLTQNFRNNELTKKIKYQIHIPSHSYTDWQKITTQKYLQNQNSELCRIFKIAKNHLYLETRIIYISPVQLNSEILQYYKKLFELGEEEDIDQKLIILSPHKITKLLPNLSLSQSLYYCNKTLKKIKSIIKNKYCYIVPSVPSNDYVNLCMQLKVPLFCGNIQKLLYIKTKSGCKNLVEDIEQSNEQGFGVLPYSIDIYNQKTLLNELTNLIFRYPYVRKWIFKIDHQINSRGIASIDISKFISKRILSKIRQSPTKNIQKHIRQELYLVLQTSIVTNKEERIIPLDRNVYPDQQQYLKHFLTRGGIIQASINNFQTDLQNSCFCLQIDPDGQWKFISNYYKLTNKNKTIGCFIDNKGMKPPAQIETIVNKLIKQKLFGFFTIQFLSIPPEHQKTMKRNQKSLTYLNGIDCHLDSLSSAAYLRNFLSKDSNILFIPFLSHPAIKQLRMQTFFHLCRLQNISFDMEQKLGNVFTFLDGLQSSCIGMMTFNSNSKEDCYAHAAEVLDFLNCKLSNSVWKDVPDQFFSIKNCINGYLNRIKKKKLKSQNTLSDLHS